MQRFHSGLDIAEERVCKQEGRHGDLHVFPRNDLIREYRRESYKPGNSHLTLKASETLCSTLVRTSHWFQLCQQPHQKNILTLRSPLICGSSSCELSLPVQYLLLTLPTS